MKWQQYSFWNNFWRIGTSEFKMSKIKVILLSILGLIIVSASGAYIYFIVAVNRTQPSNESRIIEIRDGEGTIKIAEDLKEKGVIQSGFLFLVWAKLQKKLLKPGVYRIPSSSSMISIYDLLSNGQITDIKITIPEGYRVEQIAQVLTKNHLVDYGDFVTKASPYEGTLFPDTYFFPINTTSDDIIIRMRNDYESRTTGLNISAEDLIIASIVEREAINDAERPLIAGIFKNRLKIDMKLEADPTVYYANDSLKLESLSTNDRQNYKFWQPIALSSYKTVYSPYNTYLYDSLLPGPICNPGLASIKATLNYQQSNYYYFLQHSGEIYPAQTEAEHNTNRAKYLN